MLFLIPLGIVILLGYEALIFYDKNFRYGRMWETPAVRPHEELPLSMPKGRVPQQGGEEIFKAMPAERLKSPVAASDREELQKGKVLYSKFCAQCHGKHYDGNATVGQSFFPLPADLRSPRVQFLSEGAFFKEISYGIPGRRQPPLATTIAPTDRWRIIAHLKSLGVRNP